VVYVADEDGDGGFELRAIPIDGSAPSSMLGPLGDHRIFFFELSSDGTRVVYRRELSLGWIEIYSAPLDGSTPAVRLDGPMPDVFDVSFTPDGSQCLYRSIVRTAGTSGSPSPRWTGVNRHAGWTFRWPRIAAWRPSWSLPSDHASSTSPIRRRTSAMSSSPFPWQEARLRS
jgi:hypothetical protein